MVQFKLLPRIRLADGVVSIWVFEDRSTPGTFKWIGERLHSIVQNEEDAFRYAIFVYGDGAVAWFDSLALHYLGPEAVYPTLKERPAASAIAALLHQAIARFGSVSIAMDDLSRLEVARNCG
jgi:hypothetical protein